MNSQSEVLLNQRVASAGGRLLDKVAVITGAASGIGKEIAFAFAREGARVVIADLDHRAAQQAASEIDPIGKRALGVAMDVSDEAQVESGMARAIEAFGRSQGAGCRRLKKPGAPVASAQAALNWLKSARDSSPFGAGAYVADAQSRSGLAVISRQKARSLATRWAGSFPAMIAELMAPMETPATQSG